MSLKYLNLSGLEDLWINIKNYILSKIPTKTSELTNDSGYLTSHQSLDNYVTLDTYQTITAIKVITGSNQGKMVFKNPNYTKGDAVESGATISRLYFGNGASYATANGVLTTDINSAGNTTIELCAINNTASNSNRASLILTYDKSATRPRLLKSWGDFIPNSNNGYSLGNASNIWKECYSNAYYLGSTAFGDIVTHNASEFLTSHQSLSNYVTLDGTQTIAGTKTFSSTISGSISGNAGTATTATKVVGTVANDSTGALVQGTMGTNDCFRIAIGGASNAGWAEIATGDDTNEPIYVRQYKGAFTTLQRTATLLDGSGNTSFPGQVTGVKFDGPLTWSGTAFSYNASNSLYFYSGQPAIANCFEGSSKYFAKFSYPAGGTSVSSSNANIQTLRLDWDNKYWHDIFMSPNNNYLWHRNVVNDDARGWRRIVEENVTGLTDQSWNINIAGTAASVTGTVAIANGGTGATTRLNAVKALTNEAVASPTHFLAITTNWGKAGYTTVAQAKTILGITGDIVSHNASEFLTSHQSLANYLTKTTNVSEMGRYIDLHYDNATSKYDYDARLYVDSQGTAAGKGSFKIAAASAYAPAPASNANDTRIATTAWVNSKGYLTSHQSLSNYVTLNGAQTISGNKTFSSINGVEPSSLSLPSDNVIDISSYITALSGNVNNYTASANGWISIAITGTAIYIVSPSWSDSRLREKSGNVRMLFPILKGQTVYISIYATTLDMARFIPCRGNV